MIMENEKKKFVTRNKLTLIQEETCIYESKITSSYDAYEFLKEIWDFGNIDLFEEFCVLYLNRANTVIGYTFVSAGGYSGTVADGKMIFSLALKTSNSSGLILAHNHPSGQLKPSGADEQLTKKLNEFGKLIDLPILDHIIITSTNGYYSFADDGKM